MNTHPIVLVQLPGACTRYTRNGSKYPPLGLCQLAAMVSPHRCQVLDADASGFTLETTMDLIEHIGYRMVGLTCSSKNVGDVREASKFFKRRGFQILIGGPLPTLAPELVSEELPDADYFFRGEGELIFPEIVEKIEQKKQLDGLPGIYRHGMKAIIQRVPNHQSLPFPTLRGLPLNAYHCADKLRTPLFCMMTSFGCSHRCAFCSGPSLGSTKVRFRPVVEVLVAMEDLANHGVREISFHDDSFCANRERTLEICKGIMERGIDLTWFCNARADELDPELLIMMKRAGCHQIYIGFESGSQQILDSVNKDITVGTMKEAARLIHEADIELSAGFIVGLPGETDATVATTIDFLWEVRPDRCQFTAFTPLPCTKLATISGADGFHRCSDEQVRHWKKLLDQTWEELRPCLVGSS